MKNKTRYLIRKSHRYLGIVIGIQFLMWTSGGLYFSWNDIDKVHGDHLRKTVPYLNGDIELAPIDNVLDLVKSKTNLDSIMDISVINILGSPVYRITYLSGNISNGQSAKLILADASTGQLRGEITREEASQIAELLLIPESSISSIEYLTEVGKHNEYRGKPLPAWAVRFEHPDNPVIYIGAKTGTFESIRYDTWRNFDFLWMLHTMDYGGRDDFGNILLKSFSVLGLITIFSGFLLFYTSSPTIRKWRKKVIKD